MLKAAPASTCRSRKTAGWWIAKGMRWNWTTNDRWAGHQHSPTGVRSCPSQRTREMAMPQASPTVTANRATWHIGQRVSRKNTRELGTVVENNGSMKVKWDAGRTSYFRHSEAANVKLKDVPAKSEAASVGSLFFGRACKRSF